MIYSQLHNLREPEKKNKILLVRLNSQLLHHVVNYINKACNSDKLTHSQAQDKAIYLTYIKNRVEVNRQRQSMAWFLLQLLMNLMNYDEGHHSI